MEAEKRQQIRENFVEILVTTWMSKFFYFK